MDAHAEYTDAAAVTTSGWVAPGFEAVQEAFQSNFDAGREVGAAFAAYHRGEKVVDLWGGIADQSTGRPWDEDTMVLVYSTTKGVTAMCAHRLAQEGRLDIEAPVATYWPEFAQAGKEQVTVADLLSHRAGLAWVDGTMTAEEMLRWDPVIRALERQAPSWPPGTAHGYHATTYGWLVGEVVRRVTDVSIGTYLRDEIAGPLGADFYIGLPPAEEPRVARLVSFLDALRAGRAPAPTEPGTGPDMRALAELAGSFLAPGGALHSALNAPGGVFGDEGIWHTPALHQAEIPAANGIGDARGIACLYGACVDEVRARSGEPFRVLSAEQLDKATRQQTEGPDTVLLGLDLQWGLGFNVNAGLIGLARLGGPRAFGHFGMGGSAGWADPDLHLGMAYVMNKMEIGTTGDTRSYRLMRACIDAAGKA
ncbi:MAG TPA: serine hydrolase domain-containing protein [Acidimicrobiales bacterium]|nr:serine hydrolase domain-containing protein [Acidimicrobiales bacterium]